MMYKITNALGRPASEAQVNAITNNCIHRDVYKVKDSLMFEVDGISGADYLKRIALQFGLFAEVS